MTGLFILLMQGYPINMVLKSYKDILDLDAKLYLSALLLLFYLNFHQHVTGYVQIDLDSGGALHSIFLSLWLNNSLGSKAYIPCEVARIIACGLAWILIGVCAIDPNSQVMVCNVINPPFALYTIITMGMRSYRYRNEKTCTGAWQQWCIAVLSFISSHILVNVEKSSFICESGASRLFHAIIIHAVITCLFLSVFNSAIKIIAHERRSLNKTENHKTD